MNLPMNRPTGVPCPICNNDQTYGPEDREYVRCHKCGVLRTRYPYNGDMYDTSYAKNYLNYAVSPQNTPLNLFRLGLVSRWLGGDRRVLLDFGCCVGEFARFAEHFYNCWGLEPNRSAAGFARIRTNAQIVEKTTALPLNIFSAVTLWDVIEHIEDPRGFVTMIRDKILAPRGVICITTPNVEAVPLWHDEQMRKWKHYKPKEHLFLYSEHSLVKLFEPLGFEVAHVGFEESDIRPGNPNRDILTFVVRKA